MWSKVPNAYESYRAALNVFNIYFNSLFFLLFLPQHMLRVSFLLAVIMLVVIVGFSLFWIPSGKWLL